MAKASGEPPLRSASSRSTLRGDALRLRGVFRVAIGAALAAGQVALPFACGDESIHSNTTGSGAGVGTGGTGGGGGSGAGDAGRDAPDLDADAGGDPCAPKPFVPDAAHDCEEFVHRACGLPAHATVYQDCYLNIGDCTEACGNPAFNCRVSGAGCVDGGDAGGIVPKRDGPLDLECAVCLSDDGSVGRVPEGWVGGRASRQASLGAAVARAAELEAASVVAFHRMRAELERFDAPRSLVAAASRAAVDESRHARRVARLARRFGGTPRRPRILSMGAHSLEAFALENAVEGCVRETYGALLATVQSSRASDPAAQKLYATIAVEETRHAALSAAVHVWACRRLGPRARARVESARSAALRALASDVGRTAPPAGSDAIGWPSVEERRRLAASLVAALG